MQRPASVAVFGILNIVFGCIELLGQLLFWIPWWLWGRPQDHPVTLNEGLVTAAWTWVSLYLSPLAAVVLIASGVGLRRMQSWARVASIGYSLYAITMVVGGMILSLPLLFTQGEQASDAFERTVLPVVGFAGACVGLVYPAVLLYFMTRPTVVAALQAHAEAAMTPLPAGSPSVGTGRDASPLSGAHLRDGAPEVQTGRADEILATIIPYRNQPALAAYYLGLFSVLALIPFVGVIGVGMAVAALRLGIKGLRRVRKHPEARGKAHAWVGVVCGVLWGVPGLLIQVAMILRLVFRL